jgi:hypothetical protein
MMYNEDPDRLTEEQLQVLDETDTLGWGEVLADRIASTPNRPLRAIPEEYLERLVLLFLAPPVDCVEAEELYRELLNRGIDPILEFSDLAEFSNELDVFAYAATAN